MTYTFSLSNTKDNKMKQLLIALGILLISLVTACNGATPDDEVSTLEQSLQACEAFEDSNCPEDNQRRKLILKACETAATTNPDTLLKFQDCRIVNCSVEPENCNE